MNNIYIKIIWYISTVIGNVIYILVVLYNMVIGNSPLARPAKMKGI